MEAIGMVWPAVTGQGAEHTVKALVRCLAAGGELIEAVEERPEGGHVGQLTNDCASGLAAERKVLTILGHVFKEVAQGSELSALDVVG